MRAGTTITLSDVATLGVDVGLAFAASAAGALKLAVAHVEGVETHDVGLAFAASAAGALGLAVEGRPAHDVGLAFGGSAAGALGLAVAHVEGVETHDVGLAFAASAAGALGLAVAHVEGVETHDVGLAFAASAAGALGLAVAHVEGVETHDVGLAFAASAAGALTLHLARDSAREIRERIAAAERAERYARALRAVSPVDVVLVALEVDHPRLAAPLRVVNDAAGRTIEDEEYLPMRFEARYADDLEGQAPRAQIVVDNVGRDLTALLEATAGAQGATVRVLEVLVLDATTAAVQWEITLDVLGARITSGQAALDIGFDPGLDGPSVLMRHDPQTSPGLF